MKPQLPTAEQLLPYLKRIDAARYYSNFGPLLSEFEERLAQHFGMAPADVMTAANGTTALSAALLAVGARPGRKCLVPSWTFVASAAAIWAANLVPHFVDIDARTWGLDPDRLCGRSDLADVGAVMVVSPFGAPLDVSQWDAFSAESGIPVVIDAAASFDTAASVPCARPGNSPMMISLHATKVLGTGEGAIVLSRDTELVRRIRQICNFGVWGPPGQVLGYNGKLSEYHAAVGLAALDEWPKRRSVVAKLTRAYLERLATLDGLHTLPGFGDGWISCYCNVMLSNDVSPVIEYLRLHEIETRRWWRSGVHDQPAYGRFSHDGLPVTESLGTSVFGLPFYHDLSALQLEKIFTVMGLAMSLGRP